MKFGTIFSCVLILAGAVFLFISILITSGIKEDVPKEVKKKWLISIVLMIFFLLGYLFFMTMQLLKVSIPYEIITGIIFLGGGFFVYIIIKLTKSTIQTIADQEADLWLSKEKLRIKTGEK